MADSAFQTQYRQEFVASFEQHQSLLRDMVTSEAVIKGNSAIFLVAGSGGATAVTRGLNGLIPARPDDNTQLTCTLAEWHDLVRKTGFNVFASQGNQRSIMQQTTMAVVNRKIDTDILSALATATQYAGVNAAPASLAMCVHAKTILGVNEVAFDGQICAIISPAFEAYLLQTEEFTNAQYITRKPIAGADTAWKDQPGFYVWLGVKWVVHPNVVGVGTNAEECYMFHRSAIGHAVDRSGMQSPVGYDEEQDYSWARCSINMGSKNLQPPGIVRIRHDGSAFGATA